jgi:hypothetical protein
VYFVGVRFRPDHTDTLTAILDPPVDRRRGPRYSGRAACANEEKELV